MLDWLIRNWWRWVGLVLFAAGLWYWYEGMEVDSRHAEALGRIDERLLEMNNEIQGVENELQNAESMAKLVGVSAKLVKLQREKNHFQNESLIKLVMLYTERRNTYISSQILEVAALLVAIIGKMFQSRWKRWRNQRRFLAATQEEEIPIDE